jgi:chromosomal replication initiation ATPase DnaA
MPIDPTPGPKPIAAMPAEVYIRSFAVEQCRIIELVVATAFVLGRDDLRTKTRRAPKVAFARQCAMYLAHTILGLSYRTAGAMFGRDRTTAAHACRRIEDWRDNAAADAFVAEIEDICVDLMCVVPPVGGVTP